MLLDLQLLDNIIVRGDEKRFRLSPFSDGAQKQAINSSEVYFWLGKTLKTRH